MSSSKVAVLLLGIMLGQLIGAVINHFGMQRYSDAVKECIIEKGPNK